MNYIYLGFPQLASPHGRPRLGSLVPQETLLEFSIAGKMKLISINTVHR